MEPLRRWSCAWCFVVALGAWTETAAAGRAVFGGDLLVVELEEVPASTPRLTTRQVWLEADGWLSRLSGAEIMPLQSGRIALTMPEVRVRTGLRFHFLGPRAVDGRPHTSVKVAVFPRGPMSWARRRVTGLSLGVYDPGGALQGVLCGEDVAFTDVSTRHAVDFFDGQILLVGPNAIDSSDPEFVMRLASRMADGMCVLVLAQETAWQGPGIRCTRITAAEGRAQFSTDPAMWRDLIQAGDLGTGPWLWQLSTTSIGSDVRGDGWQPWIVVDAERASLTLAGRQQVRSGGLWALQLPQTKVLAKSPVGYTLCALALIDIARRASAEPGQGEILPCPLAD